MKTVFIEARCKLKIRLPAGLIRKLPKRIALFTTLQFLGSLKGIKKELEKNGKEVILLKEKHAAYPGQLLGCSIRNIDDVKFDAFLYVGDGLFHPKALLLKSEKPVFAYNPFSKKQIVLKGNDADDLKKKMRGSLLRFIYSKEIGVIITTKQGQARVSEALDLKKRYPDKEFYFLLANTIDFGELENFPFIECFVNTACPRIGYDDTNKISKPVVNIDDLKELNH